MSNLNKYSNGYIETNYTKSRTLTPVKVGFGVGGLILIGALGFFGITSMSVHTPVIPTTNVVMRITPSTKIYNNSELLDRHTPDEYSTQYDLEELAFKQACVNKGGNIESAGENGAHDWCGVQTLDGKDSPDGKLFNVFHGPNYWPLVNNTSKEYKDNIAEINKELQ